MIKKIAKNFLYDQIVMNRPVMIMIMAATTGLCITDAYFTSKPFTWFWAGMLCSMTILFGLQNSINITTTDAIKASMDKQLREQFEKTLAEIKATHPELNFDAHFVSQGGRKDH